MSGSTSWSGERPRKMPGAGERIKSSRLRREALESEVAKSGCQEPPQGRKGS